MTPKEKLDAWQALVDEEAALLNAIENHERWPEACARSRKLKRVVERGNKATARAREACQLAMKRDFTSDEDEESLDVAILQTSQGIETYRQILQDLG